MEQQQPQGLYDIYDLIYAPWWRSQTFFVSAITALVTIVLLGTVFFLKKRKARVLPAWEEALMQLDAIDHDVRTKNPSILYVRLTGIIKNYFEQRYRCDLIDKTDEEAAVFVASSSLPQGVRDAAQAIFERAVAHKFGKKDASVDQMANDVLAVRTIIQQTIPTAPKGIKR